MSEDWDTGTIDPAKWMTFGSPIPSLYAGEGIDGSYAVNNNGDANYASGLFTTTAFDLAPGVGIEFWQRGGGPLGGLWSGNDVGFIFCGPDVDHVYCGDWVAFVHSSAEDNGVFYTAKTEAGVEQLREEWSPLAGDWHKFGITLEQDGTVSFYLDDQLKFATSAPLDFATYDHAWFEIRGRSMLGAYYYVDNILVTSQPLAIDQVANSETTIVGTLDGTFLDTYQNDGEVQSLQEVESGGKVTNRFSYLEHKWLIYVLSGDSITLNANAWRSASTDGDTFVFAYSTDDVHYQDMFTIDATGDDDSYYAFPLPPSTSGMVYVRVTDSDHTRGNRALDTVFVDHLYVQTVNPLFPPFTVHVGDLDGSAAPGAKTRWDATVTITIHNESEGPVLGATVSGIWSGNVTGAGTCTTDSSGQCSITLDGLRTNVSSVTFTVTSVVESSSYYDSTANHDPDGDSDGTSITVNKTATATALYAIEP